MRLLGQVIILIVAVLSLPFAIWQSLKLHHMTALTLFCVLMSLGLSYHYDLIYLFLLGLIVVSFVYPSRTGRLRSQLIVAAFCVFYFLLELSMHFHLLPVLRLPYVALSVVLSVALGKHYWSRVR